MVSYSKLLFRNCFEFFFLSSSRQENKYLRNILISSFEQKNNIHCMYSWNIVEWCTCTWPSNAPQRIKTIRYPTFLCPTPSWIDNLYHSELTQWLNPWVTACIDSPKRESFGDCMYRFTNRSFCYSLKFTSLSCN